MRLSDLQDKDIVNISDGKKIGSIIDVNIDEEGSMKSLVVEESKFTLFNNKNEMEVLWKQIEKIGEDVILVKIDQLLKINYDIICKVIKIETLNYIIFFDYFYWFILFFTI